MDRATATDLRDTDDFGLIAMARLSGLFTGVVLDPGPEGQGRDKPVKQLGRKIEAGA